MAKQGQTGIVWTDETWNPVTGCTKVSQGCKHCYAERDWHRLQHLPRFAGRAFTDVVCHPERLDQPLRWAKPRRIFVNSMSDLFHEDVPDEFIDQVFAVMALAKQHEFQVLTKRPQRMLDYCKTLGRHHEIDRVSIAAKRISNKTGFFWRMCDEGWCLPDVWLGVSVEDQATANERIPLLLQTPAAVRWISAEPLLGPIDLNRLQFLGGEVGDKMSALSGRYLAAYGTKPGAPKLDWVVVGGESGPKARPMVLGWAKEIVIQCRGAGVPVLMKQVGANPTNREGQPHKISDRKGSIMEEWPEILRTREYPNAA